RIYNSITAVNFIKIPWARFFCPIGATSLPKNHSWLSDSEAYYATGVEMEIFRKLSKCPKKTGKIGKKTEKYRKNWFLSHVVGYGHKTDYFRISLGL
ncbi:Insulin receptor-related protein, partial [Frankliniella fusca]